MKKTDDKSTNIVYPVGGIANALNDVTDLCTIKMVNKKKIIINTSAQPNSIPHLGTIVTLMSAFAFAKKLSTKFNVDVSIQFDKLENSNGSQKIVNGESRVYSLENTYENDVSKSDANMKYFIEILNNLKLFSLVDYEIRSYREFQAEEIVRESIIKIFNDYNYFAELLNPNDKKLHIRIPCSICGSIDKSYTNTTFKITKDYVSFESICPIHGVTKSLISKESKDYMDINTQLRDLVKGALYNSYSNTDILPIMFDGNDWSGVWNHRIHCNGLMRLGYNDLPIRVFAPLITDWSGAKFSKSLYVVDGTYDYLKESGLDNYVNFININGFEKLKLLWDEVYSWLDEPKKFFRNYSIDYLYKVINRNK